MKHKFIISFFWILMIPDSILSTTNFTVNGISYSTTSDSTVSVSKSTYSGVISIPTTIVYQNISYCVTSISSSAFSRCTALTSITIPGSVTSIGGDAFYGCMGLKSVTISEGLTSIGSEAFCNCSVLTDINIPSSMSSIGSSAFYGCRGLKSVKISEGLTSIGNETFYGCTALTDINIPGSVTSIGSSAFRKCASLISIAIPNGVTSIKQLTFADCTGLKEISIPNSVTSIESEAFDGCSNLADITISNSVTSIGEFAYYDCIGLTSLYIPSSVTSIGSSAFAGCSGLTSISVNSDNTKYDSREGCNAIIESASGKLLCGCQSTIIPSGVTSIAGSAFRGCTGLSNINIPNSVTSIGSVAFESCTSLTNIVIPDAMKEIEDGAFADCKLRDIQVLSDTAPSISRETFSEQSFYHTTLLVPVGCWDRYAYDDTYWYKFINIKENATATANLSKQQAYTLKNAATRSYLVYDEVNDGLTEIELDANIDENEPNHSWQVIEQNGQTYLYNLGAKKYLVAQTENEAAPMRGVATSVSSAMHWGLSVIPTPISLSDGSNGINVGNNGSWLFVLNDNLNVDQNVTGIEAIEELGSNLQISNSVCDLQGRMVSTSSKGKMLIQNGKKILTR